ncbi:predicted protein [Naegleria gruberi]|uniref:Predicted protein n=1 Tax=Naegleria gruberi TaxID=5762 RepID=D2VCI5_NAEGR|nr:uncharacterized protein NAEGRDRAFT_48432 [Naegleria gruberi]EFC45422.1 predicted protein [Naegleria gruberi]|eukprot:XP_002678166.1 predicted protein [Naegleria gruberi strain NEG-M]
MVDETTFESLESKWMKIIKSTQIDFVVLVGMKNDLISDEKFQGVSEEKIRNFMRRHPRIDRFFSCSSKSELSVNNFFEYLLNRGPIEPSNLTEFEVEDYFLVDKFSKLLNNEWKSDLIFECGVEGKLFGHSWILYCCPCPLLKRISEVIINSNGQSLDQREIISIQQEFQIDLSIELDSNISVVRIAFENISKKDLLDILKLVYSGDWSEGINFQNPFSFSDYEAITHLNKNLLDREHIKNSINNAYFNNIRQSTLENSHWLDVSFMIGNNILKSNRNFLSCACEYFQIMFEGNFTESESCIVDLTNDSEGDEKFYYHFKSIVEYISTGKVEMTEENAISLLTLSNKYMISSLSSICELYIASIVNEELETPLKDCSIDLFTIFEISETYQALQLQKVVLYSFASHLKEIKKDPQWKTFPYKELVLLKNVKCLLQ